MDSILRNRIGIYISRENPVDIRCLKFEFKVYDDDRYIRYYYDDGTGIIGVNVPLNDDDEFIVYPIE